MDNMLKIRFADITMRRTFQGAWECSALVNGYLVHQQYFDYSGAQAIKLFRAFVNAGV